MQVRQLFAAALLAVSAVGAMAQELDRRDQNIAQQAVSTRNRASVSAEVRNLEAQGQLKSVGELAQAPVTGAAAATQFAQAPKTRDEVKAEVKTWRAAHAVRVGELG